MSTQHDESVILAAIARGQQLLAERDEAERQARDEAERQAEEQRLAEWAPVLDEIRGRLPDWAREYLRPNIQEPSYIGYDYDLFLRPAFIELPCATVLAYARKGADAWQCRFLPCDYYRSLDDDVYKPISQQPRSLIITDQDIANYDEIADDFLLALAVAEANTRRRRAEEAAAAMAVPAEEAEDHDELPDPIDQALDLIGRLSRTETIKQTCIVYVPEDGDVDPNAGWVQDAADDRTLVLAAGQIAIAHHLRRVADGLERLNVTIGNHP